uniref:Uncharacterized protein n=1 Tax=Oryza meridionalis TaxID=40149 RepID=A0A0E0C2N3_9ORYZ
MDASLKMKRDEKRGDSMLNIGEALGWVKDSHKEDYVMVDMYDQQSLMGHQQVQNKL